MVWLSVSTNQLECSFVAILSWFVDPDVAAGAINGKIIEEDEVEVRPEKFLHHVSMKMCVWRVVESIVVKMLG